MNMIRYLRHFIVIKSMNTIIIWIFQNQKHVTKRFPRHRNLDPNAEANAGRWVATRNSAISERAASTAIEHLAR